MEKWLIETFRSEARALGNEFALDLMADCTPKKMTEFDNAAMNDYIFWPFGTRRY